MPTRHLPCTRVLRSLRHHVQDRMSLVRQGLVSHHVRRIVLHLVRHQVHRVVSLVRQQVRLLVQSLVRQLIHRHNLKRHEVRGSSILDNRRC